MVLEKSGMTGDEFRIVLAGILTNISLIPDSGIIKKIPEAERVMGHIDKTDVPFVAAALSVRDAVIWSDDSHFGKQEAVKIVTTKDMIKHFFNVQQEHF